MLAARDQENRVLNRQQAAKPPGARYPKTPLKVPLNDENATHAVGGAKSILGGRTQGNENAMTSKGGKGGDKSNFVTPMQGRARAVLGDKTTNAKGKALQTGNAKSTVREIEKTQTKAPNTVRPKQKQPQTESHKLQVHAEETGPLTEEEEVEYCPPSPKDLPYESDVFPDGVLTFDALKPENMFKGYYAHYFNPVDEHGVSLADKELEAKTKKALQEGERRIQENMDSLEWSVEGEFDLATMNAKKAAIPVKGPAGATIGKQSTARRPLSTIRSKNAADALSMDDTTRSLQRRAAKASEARKLPTKKTTSSFAIPTLKARQPNVQRPTVARKSSMEIKGIEAKSRTTIGYNKGRTTASILAQGTTKPSKLAPKGTVPRSGTTLSDDSDKTITPARYAHKQASAAAEDQQWRERVPFLSIFSPEDDDDDDGELVPGGLPLDLCEEDEEEVELKIID
ncbi:Uu.00g090630.m01.CDS01 [Anthostomella pinea]|uniref:Uu.00g090630.m01.CDS01 n=1 Tax=Anthostomella pinea TaxID=933095 RepID=A0AAI8YKB5_9PEZI|nr:Uu.00g090630.m01.CDS01 [Anthostomella pinea]